MTDQRIIETASSIVSTSTKTTVGFSGASVIAWLANLDIVAIVSLVVGICGLLISFAGFCTNFHYKRKENKRAEELHHIEMQRLKHKYKD